MKLKIYAKVNLSDYIEIPFIICLWRHCIELPCNETFKLKKTGCF